jgi:hypothetical protein
MLCFIAWPTWKLHTNPATMLFSQWFTQLSDLIKAEKYLSITEDVDDLK